MNEQHNLALRKRRAAWRAKRGLLELDCILQPFVQHHLSDLSLDELAAFETLLSWEDPDFLQVLMHAKPKPSLTQHLPMPLQLLIDKISKSMNPIHHANL